MRQTLKGYQLRDPISHRKYNRARVISRYLRTGKWTYRGKPPGLGHAAGENWGDAKNIDPTSPVTKYSKNSPSFDEGVWLSKRKRMANKISM